MIAADYRSMRDKFGDEYAFAFNGMDSTVRVKRASRTEALIYIPYGFRMSSE